MQPRKMRGSESVREVQDQDGSVLLDIDQGTCYSMNPVGSKIWEMLKAGSSLEQIVDKLSAEFDVPHQELHADVAEFIETLQKRNLLTTEPVQPPRNNRFPILSTLRQALSAIKAWHADEPKR